MLLIFGAGGPLTVEVEESCARLGQPIAALVVNHPGPTHALDPGLLRTPADLSPAQRDMPFLCPLFTPAHRRAAVAEALALGLRPALALVDPTAIRAASTTLGEGCYVNAGAILGAAGAIGRFVIVNRGASLGHHSRIGDFVAIGPGVVVAGQVEIGADALLGAGVVVAPRMRIGAGSRIAAGTVVTRDVPPGALAAGSPMRLRPPA